MPFCTECGAESPEGARFCMSCGAALAAAEGADRKGAGPTARTPAPPRDRLIKRVHQNKLFAILPTIFTLGFYYFWWRSKYIELRADRLIYRTGLISKAERAASLEQVQDVSVDQGFLGRLFGYGTIAVETAGSDATEFTFARVAGPEELRDAILDAQTALQSRDSDRR